MPPRIVLDTNVVLGWLLFRDPACMAIGAAVEAATATWVVDAGTHGELAHVLARGIKGWPCDAASIMASMERHSSTVSLAPRPHPLTCTDTDDQKFLDLAVASRAAALFSRDRAVLRLQRRARAIDLAIARPEQWPLGLVLGGEPG